MISLQQIHDALDKANHITPKATQLRPSAVLVPIIEREQGLQLLLTQRTEHLKHHAGQISFPGGRMDDSDKDLIHTALRETEEEVGIEEPLIQVMGKLPLQPTVSGFMIQPVVATIANHYEMTLSADEVADAFEVPLDFVCDEANHNHYFKEYQGRQYPIYSIPYQNRNIWGATASIIVQFANLLK
ncbi:MAG: CoA pyrophosphatase [Kangiellaceae bacterium]|nr:CoA pyrophosphatase [Kangiellaceae bacterium]